MNLPSLLIASILFLGGTPAFAQTAAAPAEQATPRFGPGPHPGVTPGYPAPAASAPAKPASAASAAK